MVVVAALALLSWYSLCHPPGWLRSDTICQIAILIIFGHRHGSICTPQNGFRLDRHGKMLDAPS